MTSTSRPAVSTPLSPPAERGRARTLAFAASLFLITAAIYAPSLGHELVSYDDMGFVNAWVKQGLTWSSVVQAFRTTEMDYWHPLTWLSYLVDVSLFGTTAWGFHFTNVLLHALNTALAFVVLRRFTGATWRSAVVAALFGLHPMHVESVAWVAERKDVLCATFWLLTMGSYVTWTRRRTALSYGVTLVSFALGLMAKPMLVTLPCVLLLLDVWPLERWSLRGVDRKRLTVRLVIEKIPFVVLAALDSALTINAQAKIGAMVELTAIPWYSRLANAAVAYGSYIAKCFCPRDLAVYYPYHAHAAWLVAVCAAALVGITAFAWIGRERRPYVLVGWLWFVGTLVPVIGLVQVGGQAMADRYTYLPYLGVFIALVWRAADFAPNLPRRSLAIVTALSLGALATATEHQLRFWQNSGTLWTHTLAVTRDNVPAHLGLGYYYSKQPSRLADAIAEYREATRLAPNRADAHYSLGVLLARTRATRTEAIAEYQAAIRLDPTNGPAYFGLGMAAEQVPLGAPEAIAAYEAALAIDPKNADAHNRLGNLLASDPNRRAEAIEHFRAALASDPASAEVRLNLGAALAGAGRLDEAIAEYRELVRQRPDFADAHNNLANALLRVPGAASDAEAEYQTAIRLKPDFIEARFNYAQLLARVLGRPSDALAQLDEILRLRPDFAPARELAAELRR